VAIKVEKEKAIEDQDFELAASKRDQEKQLNIERVKMEKQYRAGSVAAQGSLTRVLSPRCWHRQPVFQSSS
jgi:ATP-dependent Clp protease ATP-binding subunit ClpC